MVATTVLGFLLSALLNYGIGYYGFHRVLLKIGGKKWFDQAQEWHQRYGSRALLLAYVHPNVGGLMAMACGNAHYSFTKFIRPTFVAILLWNTCWGVVAYWLAPTLRAAAASVWPIFIGLLGWTLLSVCRALFRKVPLSTQ
jgi:membrane protein DedA with SNARE-associated domain